LTLTAAARAIRDGRTTSKELVEQSIAAADRLDEELGVYVTRFDSHARAAAELADKELAAGLDRGPLHGIPFGVKDTIAVAEGPTTAQSLVHDPAWGAGRDAPVVARLKAAGALITGKTTTMEFACGIPDSAKPFPVPRNPHDRRRWAGGSSSGTASGVAAGLFFAGLGSDTAGSIRMPAAFCGVTGLMPTFGRVPKSGCVPLAYSLDRVGPLARTAADCAAVLEVIAGPAASDPTSADLGKLEPYWSADLSGLRVGVVKGGPGEENLFEAALSVLAGLGAVMIPVTLPYWAELTTATFVTATSEGLAYHRGDLTSRWDDYFVASRGLLAGGALVSGADYVQAQRVRRIGQQAMNELFSRVDVVVTPTASIGAPLFDELANDAGHQDNEGVFAAIHTASWNSLGNPVLALPMGFTTTGLPMSMQVAGPVAGECSILRVGYAYQELTDWSLRVPAGINSVKQVGV
jgi:aspartyl-tRNA(Asn)/glutamyl-tRNA(Gln) amidotransferase subunit A